MNLEEYQTKKDLEKLTQEKEQTQPKELYENLWGKK